MQRGGRAATNSRNLQRLPLHLVGVTIVVGARVLQRPQVHCGRVCSTQRAGGGGSGGGNRSGGVQLLLRTLPMPISEQSGSTAGRLRASAASFSGGASAMGGSRAETGVRSQARDRLMPF